MSLQMGKMIALQILPLIEGLYGSGRKATKFVWNFYLHLLQGSHFNNFPQKTLKLDWLTFCPVTFWLKCLDFQYNQ